jgi:hypothetical protein
MKLPIRTLGLAAAALLLGSALAPAAAQQTQSGVDGQVALRSDGALFLILNGQRRWISTVVATDAEINAIPEGDPVLTGLAPAGSAQAAAKPSSGATQGSGSGSSGSGSSGTQASAKPTPKPTSAPSNNDNDDDGGELSSDIPVSIDLDGDTRIKRGNEREVTVNTRKDATCELKVRLPDDDDEIEEDSKNADSRGRCRYTIEIPEDAKDGDATIVATVREGGKMNRAELGIRIAK